MTFNKTEAIRELIIREGGDKYTNDPNDSGGKTKYGITERVARAYGYAGDMKDLPYDTAFDIYDKLYWSKAKLDEIFVISPKLAECIFDYSINSGITQSVKTLQRVLNSMNYEYKFFVDLIIDGQMGGKTIEALRQYHILRGQEGDEVLGSVFNGVRMSFLVGLTENNHSQRRFQFGWSRRVHELWRK